MTRREIRLCSDGLEASMRRPFRDMPVPSSAQTDKVPCRCALPDLDNFITIVGVYSQRIQSHSPTVELTTV